MEFKHFLQSNRKYVIGLGVAVLVVLMALLSAVAYNKLTSKPTPTAVFTVVEKVTSEPGDRSRECEVVQPAGWTRYTVQEGDNLTILAESRGVSVARIMQVNCLTSDLIIAGYPLYLPPIPTPTPCSVTPPFNWAPYSVQTGDTLSNLAASRGTTIAEIARVNCLTIEDILPTGKRIYLPQLPTPTPTATSTVTPVPTLPPATLIPTVVVPGETVPAQISSQPGTITPILTLPLAASPPEDVAPGETAPVQAPGQQNEIETGKGAGVSQQEPPTEKPEPDGDGPPPKTPKPDGPPIIEVLIIGAVAVATLVSGGIALRRVIRRKGG